MTYGIFPSLESLYKEQAIERMLVVFLEQDNFPIFRSIDKSVFWGQFSSTYGDLDGLNILEKLLEKRIKDEEERQSRKGFEDSKKNSLKKFLEYVFFKNKMKILLEKVRRAKAKEIEEQKKWLL